MGFADTMQKLGNSMSGAGLAKVEGPLFPDCILQVSGGAQSNNYTNCTFYIDKHAIEIAPKEAKFVKYEFTKADIEVMRYINSGDSWARYYLKFKDGKACFIVGDAQISPSDERKPQNKGLTVLPLERYFSDIISFR